MYDKYYEIEAKIELFDTREGRRSFIISGYRPTLFFGISDQTNPNFSSDSIIKLIDTDSLYPGCTANAIIFILRYKGLEGLLDLNSRFKIKEGVRFVGEGTITKVFGEKKILK
jgi:hypothetical protein